MFSDNVGSGTSAVVSDWNSGDMAVSMDGAQTSISVLAFLLRACGEVF